MEPIKPMKPADPSLVAANTRFGFKLFSQLRQQNPSENIFISPSSVAIALAMTYNGASGETQQAMAKTLELQGMSLSALNQANANLKTSLEDPNASVQLAIANALWARQGVSFQPDFLQRNRQFYSAQVTDLDFSDPNALSTINHWVKQNTHGKITQIVDRLQPDSVMFLINAIYFKGNWTRAFDKSTTVEQPFYRQDGSQKTHPMMSQTGDYRYYETEQFQAISLPYGKKQVSMYIFLPKKTSSLSNFYANLTAKNWQQWMHEFATRQGAIQLPRFKLEYDVALKDALSALGMGIAFDSQRATFAGLSTTPTKIDQVKHKTFVEVNEEGTEAAAATSVGMVRTSIRIGEPFTMTVDRPFFCVIRDNQSGTILFMGSVVEPKL